MAYRSFLAALLLIVSAPAFAQARSFSVGGMAIAEADIVDARGLPDAMGNATLQVTLTASAAEGLAKLTAKVGQELPIVLDGKTISSPMIVEPITGGAFMISGQFTLAEADRLAKLISGKDPLPDSLEDDTP
jgi:preprotein translocase subunit SecD